MFIVDLGHSNTGGCPWPLPESGFSARYCCFQKTPGIGAVKLAFEIFDISAFVAHLAAHDVKPLYPPKKMGPMLITAVRDPDGNEIEFTQFSESWYKHLEKRRAAGHDILMAWKSHST